MNELPLHNELLLQKLIGKRDAIVAQIVDQKSAISNITLQLNRRKPEDDDDPAWRPKTVYAREMKEGELLLMNNELARVNESIQSMEGTSNNKETSGSMTAMEFVTVAKRRLQPDVYISLMEEAEQSVQDQLYDAARTSL
jgi:hypothetical protein